MLNAFDYVQECEELMTKGITGTGDGFDLPGRRLGGFSHQPPLSSLRKTALAAAEKRVRLESLLPSGPKRLGGDSTIMVALSPIQAAAMAAERRLQDDIWCGSQSCEASGDEESSSDILQDLVHMEKSAGGSGLDGGSRSRAAVAAVSRKRSRESDQSSFGQSSKDHVESNFADLSMDASTSGSMLDCDNRSKKRIGNSDNTSFSQSTCRPEPDFVDLSCPSSSEPVLGCDTMCDRTLNSEEPAMWECGTCTLLNPVSASMHNIILYIQFLMEGIFFCIFPFGYVMRTLLQSSPMQTKFCSISREKLVLLVLHLEEVYYEMVM